MMKIKFLIWGGKGWIGSMLRKILEEQGHIVIVAKSRLQDYVGICNELDEIKPDFVLNTAGITGVPNIDFCEENKQDTFLINCVGITNLVDACWRRKIHITNYSSGCIYSYDEQHPVGFKFSEQDSPNFRGSTYSISKILSEQLISVYDNVLTLRIRLPISEDLHPKNLISKLRAYSKLVDIPNSVSILPELLPISIKMTLQKLKGTYNLTNPGVMSHNEIMSLYKKYIDPDYTWVNFSEDEQNSILKAKRSNCYLDTSKLEGFHEVTEIHEALENLLINMSKKLK